MNNFDLVSTFSPKGDQIKAIAELVSRINGGNKYNLLLGATGTGKTFTVANVIASVNKPTMVIVHNKTLAAQLYSELKELFPHNRVEYFVSNFDFYQPEAYLPASDTYIDKSAMSNEEIEMMRVNAVSSVLSRRDTIVVCSVAAIYSLSNPDDFKSLVYDFRVNEKYNKKDIIASLIEVLYERNEIDFAPGTFSFKGDVLTIAPYEMDKKLIRIEFFDDVIEKITVLDSLTLKRIETLEIYSLFPAYEHVSSKKKLNDACSRILAEMEEVARKFKLNNKLLEEQRIRERTLHDVETIQEFGFCHGIENYSSVIDNRKPGSTPYSLFDYFPKDFLLVIDESHATIPQINGMYNGDHARKESLVQYGFRLPSALDNRPLKFDEFTSKINQVVFISATPGDYELELVNHDYVEQIIRPTGLLDPLIEVRSSKNQIDDILKEINDVISNNERVLITTLTIRMAEDLTNYLKSLNYKVAYLHNEVKTLERVMLINELRKGTYDILVGINLLREGLDLPEVSKILILDADKEGFLRSERSLIQIIGRASRNEHGKVILYADSITHSMDVAINETKRRRRIQEEYNTINNIVPHTIIKSIKEIGTISSKKKDVDDYINTKNKKSKEALLKSLEKEMKDAANALDFEKAMEIRDLIFELKAE